MIAHRAFVLLTGAAAIAAAHLPAAAQVPDDIVLNIMRQCARIDDPTARLACFDNNIRSAGAPARASVPGRMSTPRGGGGVAVGSPAPAPTPAAPVAGGGDTREPAASEGIGAGRDTASLRVTRADPREPGVYLLTLANGEQWLFNNSVNRDYVVPQSGDTITIDRASLGSYLLRFKDQIGVRVRRVR